MSRTNNSIRNVSVAAIGQVLIILVGFVARKIFVIYLDAEYLGVNGLFSSVLTVLSLAELGVGPAIVFSLYKPLAQNDISVCKSLMQIYKKAYLAIGTIVLTVGLSVTPFITYLIESVPETISNVHVIYILFLGNTAMSYFFSYKRSLITASQNQYIIDAVHMVMYLIMNVLQIAILAVTKNYFLFLGLQILSTFTENLILSKRANKMFPWICEKETDKLPKEIRHEITRNIKAMVMHRVGGIVADATANLLISKFFGLLFLGLYSNYLLIFNAVKSFLLTFFNSIKASVGNFGAGESAEAAYSLYKKIELVNFWMASFCCICIYTLIEPFVEHIWLGKEFLLSGEVLLILVINFFLDAMRNSLLTFKEAYGLAWRDRYKPLVGAVIHLSVSIALALQWGVIGVFLGTTVVHLFVNIAVEAYVVFRYCLKKSPVLFIKDFLFRLVLFALCGVSTILACELISSSIPILNIVIRLAVCLIVPNGILLLVYSSRDEFRTLKQLLLNMLHRKK